MAEKCHLKILKITCSRKISRPYLTLTLGEQTFRTSTADSAEGLWNETFEFNVSYHSQLFSSIQLDLYQYNTFLPDYHVGRAEIRISHLDGMPSKFLSWYEIWDKHRSPSNVSDVGRRFIISDTIGAVSVELKYKYQRISGAGAFLDLDNLETVTKVISSSNIIQPSKDDNENVDDADNNGQREEEVFDEPEILESPIEGLGLVVPEDQIIEEDKRYVSSYNLVDSPLKTVIDAWTGKDRASDDNEIFDIVEEEEDKGPSFMETIGSFIVSKETLTVLKGIQSLLSAFNQGLEISNVSLLVAILILENHDANVSRSGEGKIVTSLEFVERSRHYFKFAMAAYGWKGLNFFGKGNGYITDSVRSQSDEKSVLEFLAIPKPDLLNFELASEKVFRPCYFIAVDRHTSSIILSVRGTMSIMDALTDLICEYQPWKGGLVHSGFLVSAKWFIKNVLSQLISFCSLYDADKLILVGHSLGAAIASLLTIMLQDHIDEFPKKEGFKIHCYAFAPPCIVSKDLSIRYQPFIDSFVYGDDIVPRLSYGAMMDFKTMLLCAVESSTNHLKEILRIFTGKAPVSETSRTLMRKLTECRQAIRDRKASDANTKLYMPGNIYHMYIKATPENRKYTIMEKVSVDVFTEILINRNVIVDHIPNKYDRGLDRVFEALLTMDDERRKFLNVGDSNSSLDQNEVNEVVEMFEL